MIESTIIAGSRPPVCGAPRKNGVQPSTSCNTGSRSFWTNGPSTRMPERPITTLGTAASISTSEPTAPRTPPGASSVRKRPIAIETGAATSNATNDVIAVP